MRGGGEARGGGIRPLALCSVWEGLAGDGVRPRSYRGTRPRFASGTLMSLRTTPPPPRTLGYRGGAPCFPEAPSGCQPGRSPPRSKEKAERPGDGCPCVGAEETCGVPSQPARRRRTPPPLHRPHPIEMRIPPQNRLVAGHTQQLIRANASPTLRV